MEYGIMTDEGLQIVDGDHEMAMEIIDEKPRVDEGYVASLSRYEVESGKIYERYTVESLPKTSQSQIERFADAVAKRIQKV